MEDSTETRKILDRLRKGVGAKSKTDLARALGIAQQSVFNAQAKGKIPDGWVRKAAESYNLSTDWLYFGEGDMYRTGEAKLSPCPVEILDKQTLVDVVEVLEEFLDGANKKLSAKAKAELIYQLYKLVHEEENNNRQPIRMFKLIQGALVANS